MATSSKVQFKLDTLKKKAVESIDLRIAQQELVVSSYEDDAALERRQEEWRADQEQRISDLFRQLGDIDNYRLSKFKINPIPEVDKYERQAAERELSKLRALKIQVEAKSGSLVADADGNISLTKIQLADFFGL